MFLNDLLTKHGVDPAGVLVMRHQPTSADLRRALPWIAAERPDEYNAYQQTQGPRVEGQVKRATHVASFIALEAGRALFVGLYRNDGSRPLDYEGYWALPGHQRLREFGMTGMTDPNGSALLFDLRAMPELADWKGRLVIEFPKGRNWTHWAANWPMKIIAIHEASVLAAAMPTWDQLVLKWSELGVMPAAWRAALAEWRGVYHILDETDGKGYVGSAYGDANILGRWLGYAQSGHGGNRDLVGREPRNFRFSVLQRLSPDLEAGDVIRIEAGWKDRLHTREFGLNAN